MIKYQAKIVNEHNGFSVSFHDLPECLSCGETLEEAMLNAKEALSLFIIDEERLQKRKLPEATEIEGANYYWIAIREPSPYDGDPVYRAALTLEKHELAGMYSIALTREQEKDKEIRKLNELINSLFILSDKILNEMDLSRRISTNQKELIDNARKEFSKLRPVEKPLSNEKKLKILVSELNKTREEVNKLSLTNKNKKKELKFAEGLKQTSIQINFTDTAILLSDHIAMIHKGLIYSSELISLKILRIRELKSNISESYRNIGI